VHLVRYGEQGKLGHGHGALAAGLGGPGRRQGVGDQVLCDVREMRGFHTKCNPLRVEADRREPAKPATLGPGSLTAGGRAIMNAWSEHLRGQALLADRIAKTMTTAALAKEFADSISFRQDADAEDAKPVHPH
jgi:hypothetical protein